MVATHTTHILTRNTYLTLFEFQFGSDILYHIEYVCIYPNINCKTFNTNSHKLIEFCWYYICCQCVVRDVLENRKYFLDNHSEIIVFASLMNPHFPHFTADNTFMCIFDAGNDVKGVSILLSIPFWFALINNYHM